METTSIDIEIHEDEVIKDINNDIDDKIRKEINKIDNDSNIDESIQDKDIGNNSKPIMEVSPNGKYLVTYNPKKNLIACFNIEDNKEGLLNPSKIITNIKCADQICVSNDKKLAYTVSDESRDKKYHPKILDLDSKTEIELSLTAFSVSSWCYNFNSKDEFIIYGSWEHRDKHFMGKEYCKKHKIIWIYSTETKNNKWIYKRLYEIPENFELISISKVDRLYLLSNNCIYGWDLSTEESIKIFNEKNKINLRLKEDIKIFSNEKFICLRIIDKIIIYSIELAIPIISLENDDILPYELMKHPDLLPPLPLLIPLLSSKTQDYIINYYWKKPLDCLKVNEDSSDIISHITTEYAFGFLNEKVWSIRLEKIISNVLFENPNILINNKSNNKGNDDSKKEAYEHLNIHLFYPYINKIYELFPKISELPTIKEDLFKKNDHIVWRIKIHDHNNIMLKVFKRVNINSKFKLICAISESFKFDNSQEMKLSKIWFFNEDIIIMTTKGLLIYQFNENKKIIDLRYWNYKMTNAPEDAIYDFKTSDKWVSYVKDNKESLLKYGSELLRFAIKEHRIKLIEDIYKKCIDYFKQDLGNNRMFLSIITSTMSLLNEYYPDYIVKYSSETTMITDCSFYNIEYQHYQFNSFQYPQLVNLTKSILWLKYNVFLSKLFDNRKIIKLIFHFFVIVLIILFYPLFFIILICVLICILFKCHIFNDILMTDAFSDIYYSHYNVLISKTQVITFMIPYIKFVNYPQEYKWYLELINPQPSPFIKTIRSDIYKTWNGKALINFKWNTYGKYYHYTIWIGFIALLICFNAAAGIPQHEYDYVQKKLLIASIILGSFYLNFEVRQFIYDPIKWIRDIGNIFDIIVYLLPICTSIYWLQTNDYDGITPFLTFSCLFLNLKLISFFRIFEIYDLYFTIVIRIAKRVTFFFIYFIMVILISFSYAFYILLSPKMSYSLDERMFNGDPNDPWNITPTYQVFENETSLNPSLFILQKPDGNTNMFANFSTSLFATCLLLTGDTSSFSKWEYGKNPTLMLLMILFTFIMVIYILNVFITLFGEAINDKNDSYLTTKAQYLAKIELFYLLPFQRRWKEWFPEVIHYYASVDETRKEVRKMMSDGEWNTKAFPELKKQLLKILEIQHKQT